MSAKTTQQFCSKFWRICLGDTFSCKNRAFIVYFKNTFLKKDVRFRTRKASRYRLYKITKCVDYKAYVKFFCIVAKHNTVD